MNKEKRAAEKRAARSHKEDVVLNRVLVWFGAAVVAELLLLLINRYYINYTTRPGEIELPQPFSTLSPLSSASPLWPLWSVWSGRSCARRRGSAACCPVCWPGFLRPCW